MKSNFKSVKRTDPVESMVAVVLTKDHSAFIDIEGANNSQEPIGGFRWRLREAVLPIKSLQSLFYKEPTYALVIVLDPLMLKDGDIAEMIEPLFTYVAEHPEFMVLPWLRGISLAQLQHEAHAGCPLAIAIVENIHLDASLENLEEITKVMATHLNVFWLRDENVRFRKLATHVSRAVDLFAWAVVFALSGLVQVLWMAAQKPDSKWANYVIWPRAASVIGVTALIIVFYELTSKTIFAKFSISLGRTSRNWLIVAHGLALSMLGYWFANVHESSFFFDLSQDWKDLLLGTGCGLALVAAIRVGRRARHKADLTRMPALLGTDEDVPDFPAWALKQFALSSDLMLPSSSGQMYFVSYSHSSAWCVQTALSITRHLKALGCRVFLDRDSLQPGEAWKGRLQSSLMEINVFVIVMDAQARKKKWVASEFMTAFMNRAMYRRPEILIVHPPEFDPLSQGEERYSNTLAGILGVIKQRHLWWLQPLFIPYTEDRAEDICTGIRYQVGNLRYFSILLLMLLGGIMLLLFLAGIILLLALPFWTDLGPVVAALFVKDHLLLMRGVVIMAATCMGFGAAYTLFGMTRRTRMVGIVALAGHCLTLVYARFAFDHTICIGSVLAFYFGLSMANMLLREWKSYGIGIDGQPSPRPFGSPAAGSPPGQA